jgi:crotonyl-CoA reductase
MHEGKIGVLCLAPREGLGVTDNDLREALGPKLHRVRRPAETARPNLVD